MAGQRVFALVHGLLALVEAAQLGPELLNAGGEFANLRVELLAVAKQIAALALDRIAIGAVRFRR